MPAVLLDDDVYAHIRERAELYTDKSESDTLRRLLKIDAMPSRPRVEPRNVGRLKKRKVDLSELKTAGLLSEGQTLFLHDYKGKKIEGFTAEVGSRGKLVWSGRRYSMSALASQLLQKQGYVADSVRGPAHWYTDKGKSVLDLWRNFPHSG